MADNSSTGTSFVIKSEMPSKIGLSTVVLSVLSSLAFGGCTFSEERADARRIRQWGNRFAAEHEKDQDRKWLVVQAECMQLAIDDHNRRFPYFRMDPITNSNSVKSAGSCPGLSNIMTSVAGR